MTIFLVFRYYHFLTYNTTLIGLSIKGQKPNRTDKTDRTDKNRADPTARRFGFGFMFYMFSVSGRFGSVRFGPKPTKKYLNTLKPNRTEGPTQNRTDPTARRFGFVLCFSWILVFDFVGSGRVGFRPMLSPTLLHNCMPIYFSVRYFWFCTHCNWNLLQYYFINQKIFFPSFFKSRLTYWERLFAK
jgi:hypothetical protein